MVDADRVKSQIPSLLVEGSTNSKRGWRAFMRNRYCLKQFKKLEDVLARAKDMDEGIQEFRRLKDDAKAASNGNGRCVVAKGESELVQKRCRLEPGSNLKRRQVSASKRLAAHPSFFCFEGYYVHARPSF